MKIERMTLDEIRSFLVMDEYPPGLAEQVREASRTGTLMWTSQHLVTTDRSRIDARPVGREAA